MAEYRKPPEQTDIIDVEKVAYCSIPGVSREELAEKFSRVLARYAGYWGVEPLQLSHGPIYYEGKDAYALIWLEKRN